MRYLAIFLLAAVLLFGCTGGGQAPAGGNATGAPPSPTSSGGSCAPAYSFSDLPDGVLSKTSSIVATVTCAAGKKIAVMIDGKEVTSQVPQTNDTQPIKLEFYPDHQGTLKLTVQSDGETVLSHDWTVAPLGNSEVKGVENDAVSFKEWRAMAIDLDNPVVISQVKMYLKRIDAKTQAGTNILVELRDDNNGNPGNVVASVRKPINATTLSDNWITFQFDNKPTANKGRYWVVLKIEQSENVNLISDSVNIHYVPIDKQGQPNNYTRQMILSVDEKTGMASETQWAPLSYDRSYSIEIDGVQSG